MEDDIDLDLWTLCAKAEAFFKILELLNSHGSKIGAVPEKIDDMQNTVSSSVRRLMRLRSIHCNVKIIKAVGFMSQLFGYTGPITILGFSENQRAIMAEEARRLNLKEQIVDEVSPVQFLDRLAILHRSPPRHTSTSFWTATYTY
ncbi:unnamed protein product [Ilex paraguariensis]|uniref:Uncharacterized protein n=1 Tax=Ilex paraguariensis TaxID=185542 RepID=A0ABC8TTX4_9AQUA